MKSRIRSAAAAFSLLACAPVVWAEVQFSDLQGWWSAEPSYAGQTSKVVLHFLEENGQPSARLSLLGIGGYEYPIGPVSIEGDTVKTHDVAFPLQFDGKKQTLSGVMPDAAVPVYRIPVEFHRSGPVAKPAATIWNAPRPIIEWQYDAREPIWAGLEFDAASRLLYVGTESGKLHALDVGKLVWTFDAGGRIRGRPTVIDRTIYVSSDAGHLWALDKRTGQQRWRADVDAGSPPRIPTTEPKTRWDRYGSSVVSDGAAIFYAGRDKRLYALDQASGKELWHVDANDMMTATPVVYRDLVIFAAYDGSIHAVKRSGGAEAWRYDAKLPVAGDLAIGNGRLFAGSRTYDLIALAAGSGKELWKHYYWLSWIESPAVVRDATVYTGSSDATKVYALDAANGTSKWESFVPGWAWARTAVTTDWVIAATVGKGAYPGSRAGSLVVLDRKTGELRWLLLDPPSQAALDSKQEWGFGAAPVSHGDLIYAADLRGRIYAMRCPA
jgi:outer membrane protein assembly factor BamB